MEIITSLIIGAVIGLVTGLTLAFFKKKDVIQSRLVIDMAKDVVKDVVEQLERQEKVMLDQGVRLDIIELRLGRLEEGMPKLVTEKRKELHVTKPEHHITRVRRRVLEKGVSSTELEALRLLENKVLTPRDIQDALGRSREHTARLLKGLYEKGYVSRDEGKKPYLYRITEKGLSLIKGE